MIWARGICTSAQNFLTEGDDFQYFFLFLQQIKNANNMKKTFAMMIAVGIILGLSSCKENYSNGEKVGNLIEFTKKGVIWDSWEGRLNLTQTGMNTSGEPFEFSFDNDRGDQDSLINLMKKAQVEGWKLKIRYHEVWGMKNVFSNRGETDYFVDDITVLDKDFANPLKHNMAARGGRVVDTVYVVIDKAEMQKQINKDKKQQ
jgi:hypothetical protein